MKTSLARCELGGRVSPCWHPSVNVSHAKPHTLGCVLRASRDPEHPRSHDELDAISQKDISPAAHKVFKEVR